MPVISWNTIGTTRGAILLAALALFLTGCGAGPGPQPQEIPLRNPTAPLASQANVTLSRLAGDWVVVQGAGLAPGTPVHVGADGLTAGAQTVPLSDSGSGRFVAGTGALWVYWIDADNRTAALGDPDGRRVWIMDRSGQPGERLSAARTILDWYGYDLARLTSRAPADTSR